MCLAVPGRVAQIIDEMAVIDYGGVTHKAEVRLTPQVKVGDFVLVHAGFIIQIVEKEYGEELVELAKETGAYD